MAQKKPPIKDWQPEIYKLLGGSRSHELRP
jgi:hypothetical protein